MAEEIDVQLVGREFVRSYYTVLNERPDCLHLFFTQFSSYVHGGVERPGEELPPLQGQAAIRDKIASFEFTDCRTKIRQVDSQETVDNAVLVQVSGELSNGGEPMRRFMQTFVLVKQSAKKYYVHNDIFRYQDEVFFDVDNLSDDQSEGNEARTEEYEVRSNVVVEENDDVVATIIPTEVQPESHVAELPETTLAPVVPLLLAAEVKPPGASAAVEEVEEQEEAQLIPSNSVLENISESRVEKLEELETKNEKKEPEKGGQSGQLPQLVPSQKPFSWASLASKNAVPANITTPPAAPKPQALIKPERKADLTKSPPPSSSSSAAPPLPQRSQRSNGGHPDPTISEGDRKWTPVEGDGPAKRLNFPDDQQLFVGNLPHNVADKELHEFFEQFGTVADVKINRKGPSTNLPNFGFVAFESTESVGKALKAKPLMLYGKHRINIEEKKDNSELGGRSRIGSRGREGGYGRGGFSTRAGRDTGHSGRPTSGGGGTGDGQR